WIVNSGLTVHDHTQPLHVLGYNLVLSPEGVQEDWPALHDALRAKAHSLQRRSCDLQGRVLLANSMVLSKLWYKLRLSSPSLAQLSAFRAIAWEAVWAGHT